MCFSISELKRQFTEDLDLVLGAVGIGEFGQLLLGGIKGRASGRLRMTHSIDDPSGDVDLATLLQRPSAFLTLGFLLLSGFPSAHDNGPFACDVLYYDLSRAIISKHRDEINENPTKNPLVQIKPCKY